MSEETMQDFEDELEKSFKTFNEGDRVTGTVISVSEDEILLDLNTYSGGYIAASEFSDDPSFHALDEIAIGQSLSAIVIDAKEGQGRVRLSLKEAVESDAWEKLREAIDEKKVYEVKVLTAVNAGVTAYVEGLRAFIPASLLSLSYVEDVNTFIGQKLKVVVVTADEENNKLVLSAKDVLREEAKVRQEEKLNALQKGYVTEGIIERIEPYGCFVKFGDELSGLVHISQICGKFLKSPNEVVKMGQKVKVKVLDIKEGKISLSMKEAEDILPDVSEELEGDMEYSDEEEATTSLAGLLKGIEL